MTAANKFRKVMGEFKSGDLHHGTSGDVVTDRDMALAIAFSEARKINPSYGRYREGGQTKKRNQKFAVITAGHSIGEVAYAKDIYDLINNKLLKRWNNWEVIKYKDNDGKTVKVTSSYIDEGMSITEVIQDWYEYASEEEMNEDIEVLHPKGSCRFGHPETKKGWKYYEDGGSIDKEVISESGNYIDIKATKDKMVIKLTEEGVDEVEDMRLNEKSDLDIMSVLFEDITANSELNWHGDLGDSGFGLTSASGVTDGYVYDEIIADGGYTDGGRKDSRVYYFSDYMLRSEVENLLNNGELILTGADNKFAEGGSTLSRIDKMVNNWNKEGRAFSHINNDDAEFFKLIGVDSDEVGITSQAGSDILYYDTSIYNSANKAIRSDKYEKGGSVNLDDKEIVEDEDGNEYELVWGSDKIFKSGDMAYNPMSGVVMEVIFDKNNEDADDEDYVQDNFVEVIKLNNGKVRNTEYNLKPFFNHNGEDFAIFGGHLYGATEGDNEYRLIDNIDFAPRKVKDAYKEEMKHYAEGGEVKEVEGYNIDDVLQHFVVAGLWASTDLDTDEPLDENHDSDDVSDESQDKIRKGIIEFINKNKDILKKHEITAEMLGHDLFLTSQGHGAGFWDRGYGDDGEVLSKSATDVFPSDPPYVGDDDKIYFKKGGQVSNDTYEQIVNHWIYFTMNYSPKFWDAFDDEGIRSHLKSKFKHYYNEYGTYGVMSKFWSELSGGNRKKLVTWVKENYTGKQLDSSITVEEYLRAVNHWVMFTLNYSPNFWDAWSDDEHMLDHLKSKFKHFYNEYGTYGVMSKFWVEMDGDNRMALATWVKQNYTGTHFAEGGSLTKALTRLHIKDGLISTENLRGFLGRTPDYPTEKLGNMTFSKCFLKPYYKLIKN